MNDIFTRGRHEESITRTERILIREPLEEEDGMQSKRRGGKQRRISGNSRRERRSDKVFFQKMGWDRETSVRPVCPSFIRPSVPGRTLKTTLTSLDPRPSRPLSSVSGTQQGTLPRPAPTPPPESQINGSSLVYVDETSSPSASVILFTPSSKAEVGLCSSRSVAGKG